MQWPDELPELDWDGLRDDVCPWVTKPMKGGCFIFQKTKQTQKKQIAHPVLNGVVDCEHLKDLQADKMAGNMARIYGGYSGSSAECISTLVADEV